MKTILKSVALAATAISTMALPITQASAGHPAYPAQFHNGDYNSPIRWAANTTNPELIPDDTTTAGNAKAQFTLTGSVAKDCSYFAGDGSTGDTVHTISLGAIGVRNGDAETTSTLYTMVNGFSEEITSSTAGCNYNNTLKVSKSAKGLTNTAAGGYDSNQFQANIPYSLNVGLTATTNQSTGAAGDYIAMPVAIDAASNQESLGAWRSRVVMTANVPAPTLGLVAGTYSDTITIELSTI